MTNKTTTQRSSSRRTFSSGRAVEASAPDYSYIRKDLKQIGILSGIMFGAMIILYFVLPYILPIYAR